MFVMDMISCFRLCSSTDILETIVLYLVTKYWMIYLPVGEISKMMHVLDVYFVVNQRLGADKTNNDMLIMKKNHGASLIVKALLL